MTTDPLTREAALAALEWLRDMGATETTGREPMDQFAAYEAAQTAQPPAATPAPRPEPPKTARTTPAAAVPDSVDTAAIAASCATIEALVAALTDFDECALKRTATNLCLYDGNPKARVMIIGEAPGRDEDIQGKPFVGRSGQLLDRMLAAIDLSRAAQEPEKSVFISNMIFWRPPGNRKPTEAETLMCLPFVHRLIELVSPEVIVAAGATPTQRLTGRTEGILRLRGRWLTLPVGGRSVPLLATLHPAYLLRQPAQKRLAWRDLLDLREKLDAG